MSTPAPLTLHVSCAIIERNGLVLAAQRSESMNMPLKWEFPGGKIDEGETAGQCLLRELMEEMGVRVEILRALSVTSHDYGNFSVSLYPYICRIISGKIRLHEHRDIAWLRPEDLTSLDWAEADYPVLEEYLALIRRPEISSERTK